MSHNGLVIQYIRSHGHRVQRNNDGSCVVYILTAEHPINGVAFPVKSMKQARSALGY